MARVKEVEWIAGGHNQMAVVETARYGTKRVVCGAPNCRPGMLTAYLPLAPKMIDGVESDGMLASAVELGISAITPASSNWRAKRCWRPTRSSRWTTSR